MPLQESGTPKPNVHVLINLFKVLHQQVKFMAFFCVNDDRPYQCLSHLMHCLLQ